MLLNDLALVSPLPVLSVAHTHTHTHTLSHTLARPCSLSLPLGFRHLPPQETKYLICLMKEEEQQSCSSLLSIKLKLQLSTQASHFGPNTVLKHPKQKREQEEATGVGREWGGGREAEGRSSAYLNHTPVL